LYLKQWRSFSYNLFSSSLGVAAKAEKAAPPSQQQREGSVQLLSSFKKQNRRNCFLLSAFKDLHRNRFV
jgi:hypothetical protein